MTEIHFLLNDSKGASSLLKLAQVCVGGIGFDAQLDSAVMFMEQIVELDGIEDDDDMDDEDLEVTSYRRVQIEITASQPVDWNSVAAMEESDWVARKSKNLAMESMSRYICVNTNEIEGVFSLDGSSLSLPFTRLVCQLHHWVFP